MKYAPMLFMFVSATALMSCNKGNTLTPAANSDKMVLEFDGESGLVDYPQSTVLETQAVTIELKLWFDSGGQAFVPLLTPAYIDLYTAADGYAVTYVKGKLEFSLASQSNMGVSLDTAFTLPVGQWVNIACTYDGNDMALYADGQLLTERPYTTPIYYGGHGFTIGEALNTYYSGLPFFFHGAIGGLSIWNRALTQSEIRSTMNEELTGKESGLLGYWDFNQQNTPARLALDRTGRGDNGVLKYGVWYGPADSL